jgi:hypothetical protein
MFDAECTWHQVFETSILLASLRRSRLMRRIGHVLTRAFREVIYALQDSDHEEAC